VTTGRLTTHAMYEVSTAVLMRIQLKCPSDLKRSYVPLKDTKTLLNDKASHPRRPESTTV
jgi:hypothetical protein